MHVMSSAGSSCLFYIMSQGSEKKKRGKVYKGEGTHKHKGKSYKDKSHKGKNKNKGASKGRGRGKGSAGGSGGARARESPQDRLKELTGGGRSKSASAIAIAGGISRSGVLCCITPLLVAGVCRASLSQLLAYRLLLAWNLCDLYCRASKQK